MDFSCSMLVLQNPLDLHNVNFYFQYRPLDVYMYIFTENYDVLLLLQCDLTLYLA